MSETYPGEYTSALARARRVLRAAGLPMLKQNGRYTPFGYTKPWTEGVGVRRLGVSDTIHIWTVTNGQSHNDERRKQWEKAALDVLRANGMPFDDNGNLKCRRGRR